MQHLVSACLVCQQVPGKAEHRWSDKFTTTGFYGWYDSVEPEARFYAKNLGENPGEPAEGQLFRTVHAVAINNIITTSNNTVFAFRYGYTQFVDNDIPNQFVRAVRAETGISVGYVRAVAPNYTFFAVETFVDELAHLAKADPVAFRLAMLGGAPRLANVLNIVADRAGWGKPLPANTGIGIACVTAQERKDPTFTASAIQTRVDPQTGQVKVERYLVDADTSNLKAFIIDYDHSPDLYAVETMYLQVNNGQLTLPSTQLKLGVTHWRITR